MSGSSSHGSGNVGIGQAASAVPQKTGDDAIANQISPVMRSVLQLQAKMTGMMMWSLKGAPGMHVGVMHKGKPYAFTVGWRDNHRGHDTEDKGNYLKLRDPLSAHYLSVPTTAQLVWLLHKEKMMDAEAPITEVLKELPPMYERLTARDLLSFQVGVNDQAVYKHLGLTVPSASVFTVNRVQKWEKEIWSPLRKKFGEVDEVKPEGCRMNVVEYLKSAGESLPRPRRIERMKGATPSHFGFCLLAAAIDRVMKKPFEDAMNHSIFNPIQTVSVHYGVPSIVKQSNTFFQPQGGSSSHDSWMGPSIPMGDPRGSAPSIFNASLNMYGICEDLAYLQTVAIQGTMNAIKTFPVSNHYAPFYEWGMLINPAKNTLTLMPDAFGVDCLPYCSAMYYDTEKETGAWVVANGGTPRARLTATFGAMMNHQAFLRNVILEGIDPEDAEVSQDVIDKLKKQADSKIFKKFFGSSRHTTM